MNAKALLTPKDLADAIGASESSLRRWVDVGRIRMSRTAGGHRRIPLEEAVRFIRESGATLVRPDRLGLADLPGADSQPAQNALFTALREGDRHLARGLIVGPYLQGQSLPALFDGPLRDAMHRLGQLWQHDSRGILIEHRATEICIEAVSEIRRLLPAPKRDAPRAMGGAPPGDPYLLPSLLVAATLADAGFSDTNFGPDTPLDLLAREAIDRKARLVWLSISSTPDAKSLRTGLKKLAQSLAAKNIHFVIGGQKANDVLSGPRPNVMSANSMTELAAFAKGLLTAQASTSPASTETARIPSPPDPSPSSPGRRSADQPGPPSSSRRCHREPTPRG
jgi:excisionase family DNA binding protein